MCDSMVRDMRCAEWALWGNGEYRLSRDRDFLSLSEDEIWRGCGMDSRPQSHQIRLISGHLPMCIQSCQCMEGSNVNMCSLLSCVHHLLGRGWKFLCDVWCLPWFLEWELGMHSWLACCEGVTAETGEGYWYTSTGGAVCKGATPLVER